MSTALAQPDRSAKQRVFQAQEKKPPSSGHAITSISANGGSHTHEKVRVTPGVQHSVSNQAMQRMVRGRSLQRKLAINRPGDIYEQQADRVADAVMRMSSPAIVPEQVQAAEPSAGLQRCTCHEGRGKCEACRANEAGHSSSTASAQPATAPAIVHDVLHSSGRVLDAETRSFMEQRFGQDFSAVQIHDDVQAAKSARAVNALAYTVANHVVFGAGQYAPQSSHGRSLLAHELAHVVQQDGAPAQMQRKCGPAAMGPKPENCNTTSVSATDQPRGQRFLFNVNCDDFAPGEQSKLEALADPKETPPGSDIEIIGMASADGDAAFNLSLSCHRGDAAAAVLKEKGLGGSIRSIQAAGGVEGTEHDATFRAVDVLVKKCVDQKNISQEKDALPATPAYAPQAVQGKDLPMKAQGILDQANRNLVPIPQQIPKGTLGFTIPMLPSLFTSVAVPSVDVQAQDVDGSNCKKCVADWKLQRPQVVSFAAKGYIVPESRFWANQNKDRRQCPSTGTFGDKKEVRILITDEAHQKIIQGEKEHFLDAQRSFDLTGGRYLANALRLTAERTPLRATSQQECRTKVANFLERLAGSPGALDIVGTEGFLNGGYTGLFVKSFLDEFQASKTQRDDTKKHTAIPKPPLDQKPVPPDFDTAKNPFGCDAFFRKDDKDSFPGIPGASSEDVIKDLDTPPRQSWHQL